MTNAVATLAKESQDLIPGVKAWKNFNGYAVCLLHYSSDPEGRNEEQRREGLAENDFLREHELSFESYAGEPFYGHVYDRYYHEDPSLSYIEEIPVWVGWDFGHRRPGIVVSQVYPDSQFAILGEVLGENQTLNRFVEDSALPYLHEHFPGATLFHAADPAGKQVTDKSEHTSFTILHQYGIFPRARRSEINEGVTHIKNKLLAVRLGGKGLVINPDRCPILTEGFRGGYRYPESTQANPEPLYPAKDGYYEHLMDALRYIAVNVFSLWTPKVKEQHVPSREEELLKKAQRLYDEDDLGFD